MIKQIRAARDEHGSQIATLVDDIEHLVEEQEGIFGTFRIVDLETKVNQLACPIVGNSPPPGIVKYPVPKVLIRSLLQVVVGWILRRMAR